MAFNRILVPVDFSDASQRALELALLVRGATGSQVTLLHVASEHRLTDDFEMPPALIPVYDKLQAQIRKRQEDLLASLRTPQVDETLLVEGGPAAQILAQIEAGGHDLVVMGTHGRTGLDHVLMGSVAAGVLRRSPVPVLVTHGQTEVKAINDILVPVDFSERSSRALELAGTLADAMDARIALLHVSPIHPTLLAEMRDFAYDGAALEALESSRRQAVGARLRALAQRFIPDDRLGGLWARDGIAAAQTILEQSEEGRFDLVVLGSRGRTGLNRALLGSVAERVVRLSKLPVLVTH